MKKLWGQPFRLKGHQEKKKYQKKQKTIELEKQMGRDLQPTKLERDHWGGRFS